MRYKEEGYIWRGVSLVEALDHAVGRTVESMAFDGDTTTRFTDGTAVRLTRTSYHGSTWTGSWDEEDFEIGEKVDD